MLRFLRRLVAPRSSPRGAADWFVCPTCGEEVRVGALACPECGADEETGWSEAAEYDDLDLPEPDVPDTFEDFERMTGQRRGVPSTRWVLGILVLAVLLIVANAVLVGMFG